MLYLAKVTMSCVFELPRDKHVMPADSALITLQTQQNHCCVVVEKLLLSQVSKNIIFSLCVIVTVIP